MVGNTTTSITPDPYTTVMEYSIRGASELVGAVSGRGNVMRVSLDFRTRFLAI